jgi:hypothetical protein
MKRVFRWGCCAALQIKGVCSSSPIKKDQACRVPCGKIRIESVDLPSRRDNNRRFSTIMALKVCYLLRRLTFNSERTNLGNLQKFKGKSNHSRWKFAHSLSSLVFGFGCVLGFCAFTHLLLDGLALFSVARN